MWPFKKQPILGEETEQWLVDNFRWLVRVFGPASRFERAQLVLPGPGFFETNGETGHEKATAIFDQVKQYCGMEDWPTELHSDVHLPAASRGLYQPVTTTSVLGAFSVDRNIVQITYQPRLLNDPVQLIATFAHELSHYLLATAPEEPICEPDQHEFLTDLTAVFLGFGVFLADAAFQFEAWRDDALGTQGWRASRSGYLPETELLFATAFFLQLKGLDPSSARRHLKPTLTKRFDQAIVDVTRYGI